MIPKSKSKFVKSLQVKKYRKEAQCFVVEGAKNVQELLRSEFKVSIVIATAEFLEVSASLINNSGAEIWIAKEEELIALGSFQSNTTALAVAHMRRLPDPALSRDEFILALDDIRDPGNLGSIIRTADWYGISKIIASEETADFYNPKVISASMGSFCRVDLWYVSLPAFLSKVHGEIFGTYLKGDSIWEANFQKPAIIVVGNEANGISDKVTACITKRITIPRRGGAESLNAAVATGIVLDQVFRNH
jgi:TrmH family RNA methyltransferase